VFCILDLLVLVHPHPHIMADWLTLAFAYAGGACMGSYPIFVKTQPVLRAKVHPIIFQSYKSAWVGATGIVLLALRALFQASPIYIFSPWGVLSAVAWVPAGLAVITAVPLIGVGTTVFIFDACTTIFAFVAGLAFFNESVKEYRGVGGSVYYMAPVYMTTAIMGMAGLIILPRWLAEKQGSMSEPLLTAPDAGHPESPKVLSPPPPPVTKAAGYALAVAAGLLSATQYALVTLGKRLTPAGSEALDPLGSWTASFGIGAITVNALVIGGLSLISSPPALHPRVTRVPGSAAGILYCASLLLTTAAVQRGGNAVVMAQKNAMSLVVSGAWGALWYREIRGKALLAWCVAAAITLLSSLLLGLEKAA